nr:immunoglobulin light chain junction region [Macaca mulatta]MOX26542.1 immunoglobulin light chain junction region [Macaca mulatta]MOX27394.1 immunoglobulin light chain junction region [Macaca mulatta]MOX27497.1 immunoglobulin light chain junction region [Macaca mulatta]MOX27967.1 immunoglobulin light chain junction region [Macaca mulatta]
CMQGKELPLTF